ncbi:MAG: hypothetical protein ACFFBD_15975 [Candidatus Hodarchaeota archaeon]
MDLYLWEEIIREICLGFFILGVILFIMTVIFNAGHLFSHDVDHDISHDVSHDISHDVSVDHDISLDHDVSLDHDLSIDHDISVDHDISEGGHDFGAESADSPTPLLLLVASFMLSAGGFGIWAYSVDLNPIIRLLAVIGLGLGTTFVVSKLWSKLAITSVGAIEVHLVRVGQEVVTITEIDERGGLVTVQTPIGPLKMSGKTIPNQTIPKNRTAFIIDRIGGHLILDEKPLDYYEETSK